MTDLIPRDAAIMAIIKQIGEGTEQWVQGNNSAVYACCASLRAIPALDPAGAVAAIREAALRDARQRVNDLLAERQADFLGARNSFNRGSVDALQQACAAILAMFGEKK